MASVTKTCGTVEVTTGWTNCTTTRLNTDDASRTTTASTSYTTGFQISDFNFGLPVDATIDGIAVMVQFSNSNASYTSYIKSSLSWNDGTNFTADSAEQSVAGTSDTNKTMGGATSLWGRSWSVGEFANGVFRVKIQGYTSNASGNNRVDYVTVTVYYTQPTPLAPNIYDSVNVSENISSVVIEVREINLSNLIMAGPQIGEW